MFERGQGINQQQRGQLGRPPRLGDKAREDMLISPWPMQLRQNDPNPWSQGATFKELIVKKGPSLYVPSLLGADAINFSH